MFTYKRWLLYGATGRTGTLIAEEAVARGHRPLLAGRDPERLRRLAERLDLAWVAGPAAESARLIGDVSLVLLTAGPFGATAPAVLRACLDAGVHYLDIANEIPVVTATLAADEEARRRGITVLPAVGFGTVASDGLARYVADQVPGAVRLDLAVLPGTDGSSAGAKASTMLALAGGGRTRHDGRLLRTRLGAGSRRQHTPIGERTLVPVPTGDLVVTGHTTGIPDISVSFPVPMPPLAAKLAMPVLPMLAWAAGKLPQRATPSGTATKAPAAVNSYLWAQATAADGRTAQAWVRTGEGYAYTARSAVLAVEATLRSEPLGATTVARAFGSNLSFEAGGELLATA
ncbi:MAG: saccharopine dehydrogenase family protein [Catenulispora sp.]